jgi:HK97 gp10 family phage protein
MIKIKGIKLTMDQLRNTVHNKYESALAIEMRKTLNSLKAATPVDTGLARDSWEIEGDSIINKVPYIDFLNHGTSKQAPEHFIEKTILSNRKLIVKGMITREK